MSFIWITNFNLSRTPPEEEFVLPSLPQMDPRLLSNAPPELLRSHSYQPPPGQAVFYPPVMGPKYAWSPRMPGRTHGPLPPDSRMYSDNSRHMYPMQHPYYGSRDMLQQQQQQQQQQQGLFSSIEKSCRKDFYKKSSRHYWVELCSVIKTEYIGDIKYGLVWI